MPEFTGQHDLRSYLRLIWRWKFLFLALLIAAPAAAYLLERGKPKIYQSSAIVGVSQFSVNTPFSSGSSNFQVTNISAVAALMNTSSIANLAGSLMKPPTSGGAIVGELSVSADTVTNFLTLTVQDQSPTRAAEIANAFAHALSIHQSRSAVAQIQGQINTLKQQQHALTKNSSQYQQLATEISGLQADLGSQSGNATILQAAEPNYTPIGPHLRRTVELGFVIGLLLAFGAVMLAEGADRRMRSPDELESETDMPLLAAIPPSAFSEELDTGPVDEEAFQMLRTALTYFTTDRALHSVLITSPGEKEGKSTIASRLALASARAGLNVILVDADLRRAGASAKFAISAQAGLGSVLAGVQPVESVMIDWQLPDQHGGRLRIVPAGPAPVNTSALISSDQMRLVLAQLEERSDLVIVDSPAALAVSDAVPLMRAVSGIVLVARMNRSSRDTIGRLRKMIESASGKVLGVVATGVNSGGYEKYSRDYYGPVDHGRRGRRRRRRQSRTPQPGSGQVNGISLAAPQNGSTPTSVGQVDHQAASEPATTE